MTTDVSDSGSPLDALLAGYAAGTLSLELHGLVAAHLTLKPDNRGFVAALEMLGGQALDDIEPSPAARREARLAAIFAAPAPASRARLSEGGDLPAPLDRLAGPLRWRSVLPGIKEHRLPHVDNGEAALLWARAGRKMPAHSHEGSEITLVLKGGFRDGGGHYRAGDIAFADAETQHDPRADPDEDCLCFIVADAPPRLTGPFGRLLQLLSRR